MNNFSPIVICLCMALAPNIALAEIYKYQDENGKWQFTDKKPKHLEPEVVDYKSNEQKKPGPKFTVLKDNGISSLMIENPFFAPMELHVDSTQLERGSKKWVLKPKTSLSIIETDGAIAKFNYRWQLGDPQAIPGTQLYHWTVDYNLCPKISQGFNGRFSHTKEHARYAVDIALAVGTSILAARDGVVVGVKDDYHMGGVNEYFLDKGNYVSILHSDGTFASYFHLLLGTAAVKPGDKVKAGSLLAKSGSSGFSSGPHLHFVINKNNGLGQISIPFQFIGKNGQPSTPIEGKSLCN